ncbi:MAG TPA: prenyltransferase/squalene oxidase repeat-containing protein [Thermomicrobiales bacterium]|nr:prenyltransferase/squalene oxidase repeat-containing protein [Thermomicrobiales bacterium]
MVSTVLHRLFLIVGLIAVLIAAPASALAQATPSPTADPAEALRRGVEWLISQQGDDGAWVGFNGASDPGVTIDAVIALAAARNEGIEVDLTKAVAYLEANGKVYARTGTGQAAKLALAAAATGQDPTTFAGLDSIGQALKGYNPNTDMYGTGLYDTALVMLALGTVGKEPPGVVLKSIDGKQMGDGSWSFDGTTGAGNGDTNTTAMLIQALVAVKHTEGDLILHGIEYLQGSQLAQGFAFQPGPGATPDANSTSLVVQALIAAGEDPTAQAWQNVFGSVLAFQTPSGSFSYQLDPKEDNLFATVQALPALAKLPFPVQPAATPTALTLNLAAIRESESRWVA